MKIHINNNTIGPICSHYLIYNNIVLFTMNRLFNKWFWIKGQGEGMIFGVKNCSFFFISRITFSFLATVVYKGQQKFK